MFPQTIAGSQSGAERQGSGALRLHLGNALLTVGAGIRFGLEERKGGRERERVEKKGSERKRKKNFESHCFQLLKWFPSLLFS